MMHLLRKDPPESSDGEDDDSRNDDIQNDKDTFVELEYTCDNDSDELNKWNMDDSDEEGKKINLHTAKVMT